MEQDSMETLDVKEIAMKWSTKEEIYKVLTVTVNIYLPSVEQINWDFIRDISRGDTLVSHRLNPSVCSSR